MMVMYVPFCLFELPIMLPLMCSTLCMSRSEGKHRGEQSATVVIGFARDSV